MRRIVRVASAVVITGALGIGTLAGASAEPQGASCVGVYSAYYGQYESRAAYAEQIRQLADDSGTTPGSWMAEAATFDHICGIPNQLP